VSTHACPSMPRWNWMASNSELSGRKRKPTGHIFCSKYYKLPGSIQRNLLVLARAPYTSFIQGMSHDRRSRPITLLSTRSLGLLDHRWKRPFVELLCEHSVRSSPSRTWPHHE
jgi:hypothetical protein